VLDSNCEDPIHESFYCVVLIAKITIFPDEDYRIGIFATESIEAQSELFLDDLTTAIPTEWTASQWQCRRRPSLISYNTKDVREVSEKFIQSES
jgi:hypothetical protein